MLLLRSGHTRRHVTATNHSMCTVQAISCLTRRSNKLLGGNEGIFKEIFLFLQQILSPQQVTQILSDLTLCDLLQCQTSVAEAKIFTKIPQYTQHLLPLRVAVNCYLVCTDL